MANHEPACVIVTLLDFSFNCLEGSRHEAKNCLEGSMDSRDEVKNYLE